MKKSFVLYVDSLEILDDLTISERGELFYVIYQHHNGIEVAPKGTVNIVFKMLLKQFKRDAEKWDITRKRRAEAGSKGGKQKVANASNTKQKVAKVAVTVNDTVNVTVNGNVTVIPKGISKEAWEDFEQHRKEIKKPLTKLSRTKNQNILLSNQRDQREIVDTTIQNRWTGLFPLKKQSTFKGKEPQVGSLEWKRQQMLKQEETIDAELIQIG